MIEPAGARPWVDAWRTSNRPPTAVASGLWQWKQRAQEAARRR